MRFLFKSIQKDILFILMNLFIIYFVHRTLLLQISFTENPLNQRKQAKLVCQLLTGPKGIFLFFFRSYWGRMIASIYDPAFCITYSYLVSDGIRGVLSWKNKDYILYIAC